MKNILII